MNDNEFEKILESCRNKKFQSLARLALKPLGSIMKNKAKQQCEESMAIASIFVGLLSFHLLIPSSTLDPGTKPAAKAEELGSYLQMLSSKLVSLRLMSGFNSGDFYPNTSDVFTLVEEADRVYNKKSRQDKKRVERPQNAPEFHQLVQETIHFANTIASCDNVLRLLNSISNQNNESRETIIEMELNWQSSSLSFVQKVTSIFACYEDVTSPFLAALGMLQTGIRSLSYQKLVLPERNSSISKAQEYLLQYPNSSLHDSISKSTISSISDAFDFDVQESSSDHDKFQLVKLGKRSKFSFLLATISHLVLLKAVNCVDRKTWTKKSSWLFHLIARAWELAGDKASLKNDDSPDETEDEKNKRQFREQFPDHRKEFSKLIEVTEASAAGEEIEDTMSESNDERLFVEMIHISDKESNLLAELHYTLYSGNVQVNEGFRTKIFEMMYSAAGLLNHKLSRSDCSQSVIQNFSAHCLAIALNGTRQANSIIYDLTHDQESPDFHHDPNPKEVVKAYKPLYCIE